MRVDLTEKLFRAYDQDVNGYLDLDEFIMIVQASQPRTRNPPHSDASRRHRKGPYTKGLRGETEGFVGWWQKYDPSVDPAGLEKSIQMVGGTGGKLKFPQFQVSSRVNIYMNYMK